MLNADILPGPVDSTTKPVDADTFLELCVRMFPSSTLSVGWTTRYGDLISNGSYSEEHVSTKHNIYYIILYIIVCRDDHAFGSRNILLRCLLKYAPVVITTIAELCNYINKN
jgi:hypothetical protein